MKNEATDYICVTRNGEKECRDYERDDVISFFLFADGNIVWSNSDSEHGMYGHDSLMAYIRNHYNPPSSSYSDDDQPDYEEYIGFGDQLQFEKRPSEEVDSILRALASSKNTSYISFPNDMWAGRLWPEKFVQAVSFWRPFPVGLKSVVVKFIKKWGDPKDFIYEIQNQQYSYKDFVGDVQKRVRKSFVIGGRKIGLDELERLRQDMHLKAGFEGKRAMTTLCDLLTDEVIKKYPELRGYKPPNCPSRGYYTQSSNLDRSQLRQRFARSLSSDSPVVVSPEDMIGGGFRQRTQRELDRAWDSMRFREWLEENS